MCEERKKERKKEGKKEEKKERKKEREREREKEIFFVHFSEKRKKIRKGGYQFHLLLPFLLPLPRYSVLEKFRV